MRRPEVAPRPCRMRLVKFMVGGSTNAGTSALLNLRPYCVAALSVRYCGPQKFKDADKISKRLLTVEEFRCRRERTVKQEVFAQFRLITMIRLFTNRREEEFRARAVEYDRPAIQASFKHSLLPVARDLDGLFLK